MPDRPTTTLRLEPHMLPALVAAYDHAVAQVKPLVQDVQRRGRLHQPWTADEATVEVTQFYNESVMDGPRSAYAALRLYEAELIATRDHLVRIEADYRRTEGDNAALWGRRA